MSLFDLLKRRRSEGITWTIRTASRETVVTADGFYALIDDALTAVEEGYTEFLVLSPSMPVGGVTFLQVCGDDEEGLMHIEAGTEKFMANGRVKILARDGITTGEALDLFTRFFEGSKVDIAGWQTLETE